MVEVSEIGLEEEEEIELDLGLSIGGSFRKSSEKPKPESKCNGFDSDLGDNHHPQQQQVTEDVQRESTLGVGMMDPQAKREIHALRRQEAKRKRQQKRWVRESEPEDQRVFKREKMDPSATTVVSTTPFPATQTQHLHPYVPVQYVPFNNGFVFPYGVSCWTRSASEKNVGQPPATECRGFRPFSPNGREPEQNGERDCVNGSSMYNSSLVSEHQSSSHEGGTSTDSHSHSAHSLAEPTQLNSSNKENNIRSQPEQSASSHPVRSEHGNVEQRNHITKEIQPKITAQAEPTKLKEEATMNSKPVPIDKPLSKETSSNASLKETKTDMGKPPKPVSQTSSLPQMPYVSTTGNGPNGKTVNGFLYRYTKTEVSIVCVCHGSTFSPAEFVQHAGGTDISHPLRHITVIPSAFG